MPEKHIQIFLQAGKNRTVSVTSHVGVKGARSVGVNNKIYLFSSKYMNHIQVVN